MFFTDLEASITAFCVASVNPLSDVPITSITFTILITYWILMIRHIALAINAFTEEVKYLCHKDRVQLMLLYYVAIQYNIREKVRSGGNFSCKKYPGWLFFSTMGEELLYSQLIKRRAGR
jgi:hypothetical protein